MSTEIMIWFVAIQTDSLSADIAIAVCIGAITSGIHQNTLLGPTRYCCLLHKINIIMNR